MCVNMCVCVQMYMGGINDQCVTGIHLLESCDFPNGAKILMEMIYVYAHTHMNTLKRREELAQENATQSTFLAHP